MKSFFTSVPSFDFSRKFHTSSNGFIGILNTHVSWNLKFELTSTEKCQASSWSGEEKSFFKQQKQGKVPCQKQARGERCEFLFAFKTFTVN